MAKGLPLLCRLLKTLKDNYYSANDKVWDTWSDAQERAFLVKSVSGSVRLASLLLTTLWSTGKMF